MVSEDMVRVAFNSHNIVTKRLHFLRLSVQATKMLVFCKILKNYNDWKNAVCAYIC